MEAVELKERFEQKLISVKGFLIMMLIVITLFYQVMYTFIEKNHLSKTMLNSEKTRQRAFLDAGNTAFWGALSTIFVMKSRGSINWKGVGIVAVILGLFNLAQESSGFNRLLSKKQILKGEGVYAEIEDLKKDDLDKIKSFEDNGDPFMISMAYFAMLTIALGVSYGIFMMLKYTREGYNSGKHNITEMSGGFFSNKKLSFAVECLVIALLNAIPVLMSPDIRGEKPTKMTEMMAGVTGLIGVVLQIMFQYTGTLE